MNERFIPAEDKIIREGHAKNLGWKIIAENIRIITGRVRTTASVIHRARDIGLGKKGYPGQIREEFCQLTLYISKEQKSILNKLCRARGQTISGYVRELIEEKFNEL